MKLPPRLTNDRVVRKGCANKRGRERERERESEYAESKIKKRQGTSANARERTCNAWSKARKYHKGKRRLLFNCTTPDLHGIMCRIKSGSTGIDRVVAYIYSLVVMHSTVVPTGIICMEIILVQYVQCTVCAPSY